MLVRGRLTPEQARADGENPAVIGKRTKLNHVLNASGGFDVKSTQLVSQRVNTPRQWVITLMQPVIDISPGQPWLATFDGTATAPVDQSQAGANFSAPIMPSSHAPPNDNVLQVTLRWGAGGAAYQTSFDYPLVGASFGLTADNLNLDIGLKIANVVNYPAENLIPIVGAFMVEGIAADPTPLRWNEKPAQVNAGSALNYSCKPYARQLRISAPQAVAGETWLIQWQDTTGHVMWAEKLLADAAGIHAIVNVPANSSFVEVENDGAGAHLVYLEWLIGLT